MWDWAWQSCDTQVAELSTDSGLSAASPLTSPCHPNPAMPKYPQLPPKTVSWLCSAHTSMRTTLHQDAFSPEASLSSSTQLCQAVTQQLPMWFLGFVIILQMSALDWLLLVPVALQWPQKGEKARARSLAMSTCEHQPRLTPGRPHGRTAPCLLLWNASQRADPDSRRHKIASILSSQRNPQPAA